MCGIFGYIGTNPCDQLLLNGLRRLEYRGYDSAGIVTRDGDLLWVKKASGKVENLLPLHLPGTTGIAHTRWATHGCPSKENAHPHLDSSKRFAIVHNGIIENHRALKEYLVRQGVLFSSETDSEIFAHLIAHFYQGSLLEAVKKALQEVEGAFGLLVLSTLSDELIAARRGSPLVIGLAKDARFVASDPSALIEHTREVLYLDDGEIALLSKDDHSIVSLKGVPLSKEVSLIKWDVEQLEKGGYEHFMLKEIYEQPAALRNAIGGRIGMLTRFGRLPNLDGVKDVDRVVITACGTSYHAGLLARNYFESLAKIPCQVEYASELRYSDTLITDHDLIIAISQSGETADTLEALKKCKRASRFGVVNVVGSTIARQVDAGLYLKAGPEIGVASTKAFTTQVVALLLMAIDLALRRQMLSREEAHKLLCEIESLEGIVKETLCTHEQIKVIAKGFEKSTNALYLGRGLHYPVALEGALKLKEISYIHAEGLPAAEMKHGPIALIDENMPVIVCAPADHLFSKVASNIQEVRARGGRVIAITTDDALDEQVQEVIRVPLVHPFLQPIVSSIPLQLLAYEVAVLKGCDVDKPRNLSKSVTVE